MSSRKIRKTKKQSAAGIDRSALILLGAIVGALVLVAAVMLINQQQQNSPPAGYVPEVTGAPRVAVAEDLVDYGDVQLNSTVETVFHVQNVGDQPLHVQGEPQVELIEGC